MLKYLTLNMHKLTKLETSEFFHIYNRGNNRELLFMEHENYKFFLKLFSKHLSPILEIFAYCLLPNHFHFLVQIKDFEKIIEFRKKKYEDNTLVEKYLSQKFSNFFNAYAKSFNNYFKRHGSLFQERFGRIKIDSEEYFSELVRYIHLNPVKHAISDSYDNYLYSSYRSMISTKPTKLMRNEVLEWFGGQDGFVKFHLDDYVEGNIKDLLLE
jgi:putative transposase